MSLVITRIVPLKDDRGNAYYRVELRNGDEQFVLSKVSGRTMHSYGRFRGLQIEATLRPYNYAPCEGVTRGEVKRNWRAYVRTLLIAEQSRGAGSL